MQTSFMHPPFGFALFYLRSVAPSIPYLDRITKKEIPPVTTMQIYWGAVPFVIIQVVMVALIIFFPGIVSSGLDKEEVYDMDKIGAEMQAEMTGQTPAMPEPQPEASATPDAPHPAAPEPAAAAASDDPMKAMMESMEKNKK
jgi:GntP family gluconate:H+ symporter